MNTLAQTALIAALLSLVYIAKQQQRREIQQLKAKNDNQRREIQFLEQELQIAVSISKRLQETLSARFAAAYAPEIQTETAPPPLPEYTPATRHFTIPKTAKPTTTPTAN